MANSSQSDQNSHKRRKCMQNNSEETWRCKDFISSMPDGIIHHILSFLQTKEAIQTSVLSKRWETMWESVPTLSFHSPYGVNKEKANFIDRTLVRYRASRLNKFLLDFFGPEGFETHIYSWVKFATSRQVEELELSFCCSGYGSYIIPQFLYNHSFLVKLSLQGCTLPNACVSWKLLKELCISSSDMSDEIMVSILSGCSLLEYMRLEDCPLFKQIASTSLLKLEINGYTGDEDEDSVMMEICTPNLQYFTLSGEIDELKCILKDVSSLRQATLTFQVYNMLDQKDYMKEFLGQLSHVPHINLGMWCLKVLSMRELKRLHLPPLKWKTLNLEVTLLNCIVPAILNLLKSLPDLRKLIIHFNEPSKSSADFEDRRVFEHFQLGKGGIWISRMRTIACPLLHLNIIEITGKHNCLGSKVGRLVVDFLIRNSSVLQKMVLTVEQEKRKEEESTDFSICISYQLYILKVRV